MDSFSARLNAAEGSYFRSEQNNALKSHLEKLVNQGKLPLTALDNMTEGYGRSTSHFEGNVPVTVINSRPASEVIHNPCLWTIQFKAKAFPRHPESVYPNLCQVLQLRHLGTSSLLVQVVFRYDGVPG